MVVLYCRIVTVSLMMELRKRSELSVTVSSSALFS